MLVKRELIITGDGLAVILEELKKIAEEQGYEVEDVYHEGFHSVRVKVGNGEEFCICEEKGIHQLRVWPGFPGDEDEKNQWNAMLEEFYEKVAEPVSKSHKVDCSLTESEKDIDDFFSDQLVGLLRQVVDLPETSNTRWNLWGRFLVLAVRESGGKYRDELYDWLREEGQTEKMADKMLDDFDMAHWILSVDFRLFPEHSPAQGQPD